MKRLASLLMMTLWLGGCAVQAPPMVHQLVPPAEFVSLGQQSSTVADALCVKVESVTTSPPSAEQVAPTTMQVTFQITQVLVGQLKKDTWTVAVDPSLASQPGLSGEPFFIEGRTYRLFLSGDQAQILQVGSLAQFDQFITDQLGRGQRGEVNILPLRRR